MIIPKEGSGVCVCECRGNMANVQSSLQTGLNDYVRIRARSGRRKLYPHVRRIGQSLSIISCVSVCTCVSV